MKKIFVLLLTFSMWSSPLYASKINDLLEQNFKIVKGKDFLTLYKYHTKVAEHYFCSNCGIYTHTNPRSNHDKVYMINIGCIEGVKPLELKNIIVNDGENHPLDQKK